MQRWRLCLCLILLLSGILRGGAALGMTWWLEHRAEREFLIEGDAAGYWELGKAMAEGRDYAIHSPPRRVHRMPGLPAVFAASILLFGESLLAARLVLAGIGVLASGLVFLLGRRLLGVTTGLLAAFLAAVSPAFIGLSVLELSETPFAAALLWSLIAGDRLFTALSRMSNAAEAPASRQVAAPVQKSAIRSVLLEAVHTGVAIAIGVYFKPSWILAAPCVSVLLLLLSSRRGMVWVAGVIVPIAMVVALLPWGLRNQQVSGHFKLTTFWMGPSLYDGLRPDATGDSDMRFFDDDGLQQSLSEFDIDQHYKQRAWEFARQHPGRVLQLAGEKSLRYWTPWPNAAQFRQPLIRGVFAAFTSLEFLLAAIGAGGVLWSSAPLAAPRRRIWTVAICLSAILYFAALHTVFVSSVRYRIPAEYPLLILTAAGGLATWRRLVPARGASTQEEA